MRKFHFTLFFLALLILVVGLSVSLTDNDPLEANKARTRQFYEEVINKHNPNAMDEFIATNFVDYNPNPGQAPGVEGVKQIMTVFFTGFPDLHFSVEDQIAEGDKVVSRLTVRGTHKGDFMNIPATGKQMTITGIDIIRIKDGRAVERWGNFDDLGMMQQLGVVPAPASEQTAATLAHHLEAFGVGDVNEILKDYTEASLLITPDGPLRGLDEIRLLFEKLTTEIAPPGASEFEMLRQVIEGETAYIVWTLESANYKIPLGTDTFLIRKGKIETQTFAGQILPKGQ